MKIVVYPHDLNVGGSQLNAIELAAACRDLGHEALVFGRPGTLVSKIEQLGLEFVESPDPSRRPSPSVVRALAELIEDRGIDIVHGYEWPPALEAYLAGRRAPRATAVATVMSMAVAPFIPRTMPLVVGTEQIAAVERSLGRRRVSVLEPPVDLRHNRPAPLTDVDGFRSRYGIDDDRVIVGSVTRLAHQLKLEGLLSAIEAVDVLARERRVRLLIVGDGPAHGTVRSAADRVNDRHQDDIVVLTGELEDPRLAYQAIDVAIGMGGSALRTLAFARPLIVQGERGFFDVLTPESLPEFRWQGWYGVGTDSADGTARLIDLLRPMVDDPARRAELGAFGRSVVESFSLTSAAVTQLGVYGSAQQRGSRPAERVTDVVTSAARFGGYHVRRRATKLLGRRLADDFNARPVAAHAGPRPSAPASDRPLVYFAGAPWHAVIGTDRRLAEAIAGRRPVLWVDPPISWWSKRRRGLSIDRLSEAAPNVIRVHTTTLPGVSRPMIRSVARLQTDLRVRRLVSRLGLEPAGILVSSPEAHLAGWRRDPLRRLYFATDDFVAGARLLGGSTSRLRRSRDANLRHADEVLAVSDILARRLDRDGRMSKVLMNGCDPRPFLAGAGLTPASDVSLQRPIAGVVGQLNDRLDLASLEAVSDAGVNLLLVGPRYAEQPDTVHRLQQLISRPTVQWIDRQPPERVPSFLAAMDVGLTPYLDDEFNRASFPLKTMEYLAAGLPVVSSALPAVQMLATELISCATSPTEFADQVKASLGHVEGPTGRADRAAFAQLHSWDARAEFIESLLAAR